MQWFTNCTTQAELKKQMQKYRSIFHPDRNNQSAYSNRVMAEINIQYKREKVEKSQQSIDLTQLDEDASWKQQARREFVEQKTIACQSALVNDLIEKGIFSTDDIQNYEEMIEVLDVTGEYRWLNRSEYEEYLEWLQEAVSHTPSLEEVLEYAKSENSRYPEILEWWLIESDSTFMSSLLEQRECVLENEYGTWWGRTTSGQSIYMDGVIHDICNANGWYRSYRRGHMQ